MFSYKDQHCLVELNNIVQITPAGALPLIVYNSYIGEIIILIACFQDPEAQIDVLTVHEEGFIHEARFVQNLFSYKHKSAGNNFGFCCGCAVEMREIITVKQSGMRKQKG